MAMERFQIKPAVYFGTGALAALEELEGKRVLIVTDAFLSGCGLLDRVRAHLPGCAVEVFDQVTPDPSLTLVAQGARVLAGFCPEALVAFGGGSPMDCAKAMVEFGKSLWPGPRPRFYAVPTTAGTGSEATAFAVLTDTQGGVKYPVVDDALLPDAAVLDASLLAGVPPAVTADTGMDVLTHALEAYVAAGASPFSDALAEKAAVLAYGNLKDAFASGGESRAKEQMLLASCLAGMAFNSAGLGVSHALAHALGGRFHVPHGRLNALLLPHVIRFNAASPAAGIKYGHLAKLCGLAGNARALAAAVSRLRQALGLPERLCACGVEEGAFAQAIDAVAEAALQDRCAPSNPRAAAVADLRAILKEVG